MTLNQLKFELLSEHTAEAYVQVSTIPDEQLIFMLFIDEEKRNAYVKVSVSLPEKMDRGREFHMPANYAEAENIFTKLRAE